MNTTHIKNIPIIDFTDFSDPEKKAIIAEEVGKGLKEFGFIALKNHGIDPHWFNEAYREAGKVFALTPEQKQIYIRNDMGNQRGYMPLNGETHPDSPELADFKECWQVGRAGTPNIFPAENKDFDGAATILFNYLEHIGVKVVEALDIYLDAKGYLRSLVEEKSGRKIGTHLQRYIHYPPLTDPKAFRNGIAMRGTEHRDLNLITLLPTSTNEGLEILTRSGEWLRVNVPPGLIIVNAADMLRVITEGLEKEIPSTPHRVVGEAELAKQSRYSMPMFIHPNHNLPLINLATGRNVVINGKEVTEAGIFVYERLKAILKNIEMPDYETWRKENWPFVLDLKSNSYEL